MAMASPWDELNLKGMSREEYRKLCNSIPLLEKNAHSSEKWSDFSFKAPDGREFAFFFDGESIKHRLRASNVEVTPEQAKTLDSDVAGFILEVGTEEPPFIFSDRNDLCREWCRHHEIFSVPLSQDETDSELFGYADSEDEEDD